MNGIRAAIGITWIVFWVGWLLAAGTAKASARGRRFPAGGLSAVAVIVLIRVLPNGTLSIHSRALGIIGAVVFASGLALAVWARVYLGRNWGMPMTVRAEPELVPSGPYRFVRHPIYTGLLTAMLGTVLVNNLLGLIVVAVLTAYFYYCGTVEERNLAAAFPAAYPEYRARTKMLIPFLL